MFLQHRSTFATGIALFLALLSAQSFAKDPLFPRPVQVYGLGVSKPGDVMTADLNGDGRLDLIMLDGDAPSCCVVVVLLNNGDGTLGPPIYSSSGGFSAQLITVADVNGDHKPDLVVTNNCSDNVCTASSIGVLLGNGDGTFQPAHTYLSGGLFLQVVVGDVNGDGKPDLVVANLCSDNTCTASSVGALLGNGDGTFQPVHTYLSGGLEPQVAIGDVTGDGKPDLVVLNRFQDNNNDLPSLLAVLPGNGDGTFRPAVTYPIQIPGALVEAFSLALADLDHDNKLDVAIDLLCLGGCTRRNYAGVLLGNGDGTFQTVQTYPDLGSGGTIAVLDINGDGFPDVLQGGDLLLGNGDGSFRPALALPFGPAVLVDLNRDGALDLVAMDTAFTGRPNHAYVSLGNGDGTFQATVHYRAGGFKGGFGIAVADVNGDGRPDLITTNMCSTSRRYCGSTTLGILISDSHFVTITTLASSSTSSARGENVTLTATVTSKGGGVPAGKVIFKINGAGLTTLPLTNGVATLTTSHLPAGTLSLTATYKGDAESAASTSAVLTHVVNKAVANMTLTSSLNPSTLGKPVMFIAKVTSPTTKITGFVTFAAGSQFLGTVLLFEGKASVETSTLPTGDTSITATYSGSADVSGTSQIIVQHVN